MACKMNVLLQSDSPDNNNETRGLVWKLIKCERGKVNTFCCSTVSQFVVNAINWVTWTATDFYTCTQNGHTHFSVFSHLSCVSMWGHDLSQKYFILFLWVKKKKTDYLWQTSQVRVGSPRALKYKPQKPADICTRNVNKFGSGHDDTHKITRPRTLCGLCILFSGFISQIIPTDELAGKK